MPPPPKPTLPTSIAVHSPLERATLAPCTHGCLRPSRGARGSPWLIFIHPWLNPSSILHPFFIHSSSILHQLIIIHPFFIHPSPCFCGRPAPGGRLESGEGAGGAGPAGHVGGGGGGRRHGAGPRPGVQPGPVRPPRVPRPLLVTLPLGSTPPPPTFPAGATRRSCFARARPSPQPECHCHRVPSVDPPGRSLAMVVLLLCERVSMCASACVCAPNCSVCSERDFHLRHCGL